MRDTTFAAVLPKRMVARASPSPVTRTRVPAGAFAGDTRDFRANEPGGERRAHAGREVVPAAARVAVAVAPRQVVVSLTGRHVAQCRAVDPTGARECVHLAVERPQAAHATLHDVGGESGQLRRRDARPTDQPPLAAGQEHLTDPGIRGEVGHFATARSARGRSARWAATTASRTPRRARRRPRAPPNSAQPESTVCTQSFHTGSWLGFVTAMFGFSAVPPTPVTSGWLAGLSTASPVSPLACTQSSDPESPDRGEDRLALRGRLRERGVQAVALVDGLELLADAPTRRHDLRLVVAHDRLPHADAADLGVRALVRDDLGARRDHRGRFDVEIRLDRAARAGGRAAADRAGRHDIVQSEALEVRGSVGGGVRCELVDRDGLARAVEPRAQERRHLVLRADLARGPPAEAVGLLGDRRGAGLGVRLPRGPEGPGGREHPVPRLQVRGVGEPDDRRDGRCERPRHERGGVGGEALRTVRGPVARERDAERARDAAPASARTSTRPSTTRASVSPARCSQSTTASTSRRFGSEAAANSPGASHR